MDDGQASRVIETLLGRSDALETLRTPRSKRELEDALGVSRSTVNRAIRDLETFDLVTRVDGRYRTTVPGEVLLDRLDSLHETVEQVVAASPVLTHVPAETDLPYDVVRSASVHPATLPARHRAMEHVERVIRRADRLEIATRTITGSNTPRLLYRQVLESETTVEFVVERPLARYLHEDHHDCQREMVDTGRHHVYEVESVPVGVVLAEGSDWRRFALLAYTEHDELAGVLDSQAPEAVDWASRWFQRLRQEGREITADFRT